MCGIVGAVASRNITPILVEGLKRLEYRGYDSCGVAVHADGGLKRARSVSRVAELAREVTDTHLEGFTGIAHTRWATHGAPALNNAHPHFSRDRIALVHNGIIENHDALRDELKMRGYVFESRLTPKSSLIWSIICTTATCSPPCSRPCGVCRARTQLPCSVATNHIA